MRRVALLVGNQNFEPDSGLTNLKFPSADVNLLKEMLVDPKIGGYDRVESLIDGSSNDIMKLLNTIFNEEKGSSILFYYSGHGKPADNGKLYLAARDTNEEMLFSTGVKFSSVLDFKDGYGTSRFSIILDCCFAGLGSVDVKGTDNDRLKSFTEGRGVFFMGAANATSLAKEDESLGHGFLTAAIADGLRSGAADVDRDGRITGNNLFDWCCSFAAQRDAHLPVQVNSVVGNELIIAFAQLPMSDSLRAQILQELQHAIAKGMLKGTEYDQLKEVFRAGNFMPQPGTIAAAFAAFAQRELTWEEFLVVRSKAKHETGRVSDVIESVIRRLPETIESEGDRKDMSKWARVYFSTFLTAFAPAVFCGVLVALDTSSAGEINTGRRFGILWISVVLYISIIASYLNTTKFSHRAGIALLIFVSELALLWLIASFGLSKSTDFYFNNGGFASITLLCALSSLGFLLSTWNFFRRSILKFIEISR